MRWTVPESREMGCLGAFGGRAVVGVMGKADKQEMAGGGGAAAEVRRIKVRHPNVSVEEGGALARWLARLFRRRGTGGLTCSSVV